MSDNLFPSGPWTGFYNYFPGHRHRMDLHLAFANGRMSGDGNDDIGRFLIKGSYDTASLECTWTKSYIGAHNVSYRGFREGKGIWGTWEIVQRTFRSHGGFHIWPRKAGEGEEHTEAAEDEKPVADAIGTEAASEVKSEIRIPKSEGSPNPEIRISPSERRSQSLLTSAATAEWGLLRDRQRRFRIGLQNPLWRRGAD